MSSWKVVVFIALGYTFIIPGFIAGCNFFITIPRKGKGLMTEVKKDIVGRRIKQLREQQGWTQSELARKAVMSQAAISQFEEGNRLPSMQALEKIAGVFQMSVSNLLADLNQTDAEKEELIKLLTENLRDLPKESIVAMNRLVTEFKSAMPKQAPPKDDTP